MGQKHMRHATGHPSGGYGAPIKTEGATPTKTIVLPFAADRPSGSDGAQSGNGPEETSASRETSTCRAVPLPVTTEPSGGCSMLTGNEGVTPTNTVHGNKKNRSF